MTLDRLLFALADLAERTLTRLAARLRQDHSRWGLWPERLETWAGRAARRDLGLPS